MSAAYAVALALSLGCTSSEPAVETPVQPQAPVETTAPVEPVPDTLALRHILVRVDKLRTLDEAMERIGQAQDRLDAGEAFTAVALDMSDDPSGRRGGWLGASTRDAWVPEFSEAAWRLQEGEVSPPVVTEFGVHLIQREPLVEMHLKHIVVQHQDSGFLEDDAEALTREQARARLEEAQQALADGTPWEDVARQYSNGPMGKRGGDLGLFHLGELGPAIDDAVRDLQVGQTTDIVETPFGYHLLHRYQ